MDPCELDSIKRKKREELIQLTIVLVTKLIVIVTTIIHEQVHQIKEVPMQARDKIRHRLANVNRLIRESDVICKNELREGCYYLVDAGYTNCEGFLAPYRGHNYHIKDWGDKVPENPEEYFNMKHAKARNVIERCFGLLKGRWAIFRSPSFFSILTQGRIVSACALLHNLIRKYMPTDVGVDLEIEEEEDENEEDDASVEYITQVSTSDAWNDFRNSIAHTSFNNWMSS